MQARLELALQKGCDGVEPDNMTAYTNTSGFALTAADQLAFNRSLANAAHTRGLSIGLKNDLGQINELVDYFDFAVNEECFEFAECANLEPFTNQGKPVFNAEYSDAYVNNGEAQNTICEQANNRQFQTLILPLALDDSFRFSCK